MQTEDGHDDVAETGTYSFQVDAPEQTLDPQQIEAIALCTDLSTNNRIAAITGPAGTGKTTIMRKVYQALRANGYSVALCAPTGKAAKRIKEATGLPAQTIHLLLEYPHPGERNEKTGEALNTTLPRRWRDNPLDADAILCDEAAMISHDVYRNLIDAMKRGSCIRFFGDINQLPPIEKDVALQSVPSPFGKTLEKYKHVFLSTLHRQGEGSSIVENGKYITQGRLPRRLPGFNYGLSDAPLTLLNQFLDGDENAASWATTKDQIITPTNVGWLGTHKLNAVLQNRFQKDAERFVSMPRHKWNEKDPISVAVNDKVIWTENNYDLNIFNGETGIIMELSDFDEVIIDFGDRSVVIPPTIETTNKYGKLVTYDPRVSLDLAYAVTTHKSQGSEYGRVAYVMHSSRPFGLNRKNFYTAVTRARDTVEIFADQRALTLSMRSA